MIIQETLPVDCVAIHKIGPDGDYKFTIPDIRRQRFRHFRTDGPQTVGTSGIETYNFGALSYVLTAEGEIKRSVWSIGWGQLEEKL